MPPNRSSIKTACPARPSFNRRKLSLAGPCGLRQHSKRWPNPVNAALGPPASSSSTSVARSRTCRQVDWEKDAGTPRGRIRQTASTGNGLLRHLLHIGNEVLDGCNPQVELISNVLDARRMIVVAHLPGAFEGFLLDLHAEGRRQFLDIAMGDVRWGMSIHGLGPDLSVALDHAEIDRRPRGPLPS